MYFIHVLVIFFVLYFCFLLIMIGISPQLAILLMNS